MSTQTTETTENLILEVRRTFPVSRERLFAAWTDPEEVRQWFGPEGIRVLDVQMDVRPGGKYVVKAKGSEEHIYTSVGEYREVIPPSKLVYTWRWADDPAWDNVDSLVTVEFIEQPGGAELRLTHQRFPSAESRNNHEQGWSGTLGKLARHVAP